MPETTEVQVSRAPRRTEQKKGEEKPRDQIDAEIVKDQHGNMNLVLTADKREAREALRDILGDTHEGYPERLPTLYLSTRAVSSGDTMQVVFQLRRTPELSKTHLQQSSAVPIRREPILNTGSPQK